MGKAFQNSASDERGAAPMKRKSERVNLIRSSGFQCLYMICNGSPALEVIPHAAGFTDAVQPDIDAMAWI
jgi:hypothetical protein